jgi:hypothetical protein
MKAIPPVKKEITTVAGTQDIYEHPAFGTITVTRYSGGNSLFGSDITTMGGVCLAINRAELKRDLHRDWIHPRQSVIEVHMSTMQFAELMGAMGKGEGIPCTITRVQGELMPRIQPLETKAQIMQREIRDMAKKQMEKVEASVKDLEELVAGGKVPMQKLREILRNLQSHVGNTPSNMAFTVESAMDTLEESQNAAKQEVVAFINDNARRLGLESLQQLGQLTGSVPTGALPDKSGELPGKDEP